MLNEGLQKIENDVFHDCESLQSITIPSTVSEIDHNAFRCCTNLRDVVLNDGLKKIKSHAFVGCRTLQSITIPSTAIHIEQYAFRGCGSLQEIVIHNEKVQISFLGCTSLERFKFPSISTRLNNIIQVGHTDIEAKMNDIPAVEWRGGELIISAVRRGIETYGVIETLAEVDKEKLDKIVRLIRHYEMKEATTLFEIALWKARIDQADISIPSSDRGACRVEVPGPVKDTILQYLWPGGELGYN